MNFPPIIPSAVISAEQRARISAHPIYEVRSMRHIGHTMYIKRLNGPIDRPLNIQERWTLANLNLRPDSGPSVAIKPYHTERRRYLVAWSLEALLAHDPVLPLRRSI